MGCFPLLAWRVMHRLLICLRLHSGCVVLSGCLALLSGCQEEEATAGPGEVLQQFVTSMQRVHGSPEVAGEVVQMLWEPARKNLMERARRASALSGRELTPGEMIVPSWFALHVWSGDVDVRIDGTWAEVTCQGPQGEQARARLVQEDGKWRVALELPPLSPIRHREEPVESSVR